MSIRLDMLISSCTGDARDSIEDCIMASSPEAGYFEARRILEMNYGQEHAIVEAYVSKLTEGPPVRQNDAGALSRLARDMKNCEIACGGVSGAGLNTQHTVSRIFKRLPRYLQDKFMAEVSVQLERGCPITFAQLSAFLQKRALVEKSFLGQLVNRRVDKTPTDNIGNQRRFGRKIGINTAQTTTERKEIPMRESCACCSEPHALWKCKRFGDKKECERRSLVKSAELCFNCLGRHKVRTCESRARCRHCEGKHHTLLHRESSKVAQGKGSPGESQEADGAGITKQVMSASTLSQNASPRSSSSDDCSVACASEVKGSVRRDVKLKVVPVRVWSNANQRLENVYAFLDEGSDTSLCTESLKNRLIAKGKAVTFSLSTINGTDCKRGQEVSLTVQGCGEQAVIDLPNVITVSELPELKSSIPVAQDTVTYADVLNGVTFPDFVGGVELLIGVDVPAAHRTLECRISQRGGPDAVRTPLGWSLVGPTPQDRFADETNVTVSFVQTEDLQLHRQLQRMYESDFVASQDDPYSVTSVEDRKVLGKMEGTIAKVEGHYQVALPWRSANPRLLNNKFVAVNRLNHLKRRLEKDLDLQRKYRYKIEEYLEQGYARRIPPGELAPTPKSWYLPHHATGPKFRIVFDCAARCKGTSLNDCLLQGPDQTSSLIGVLLRFRNGPVAVLADIKAMFHQVRVDPRDWDSLRFLWWPDGDLTKSPEEYQMQVHLFGATLSPSVCGFALRRAAVDNETGASEEVKTAVNENFYVDDFLRAFQSDQEAVNVVRQLVCLLESCGFHLTKFVSNRTSMLRSIPDEDRRSDLKEVELDSSCEKALGVSWFPTTDEFQVRVNVTEKSATRRGILSTVSQCYDPRGLIQPALLPAKRFLQELCEAGLGWDDPVNERQRNWWQEWLNGLKYLQCVRVPRSFGSAEIESSEIQLHCFCDASKIGYGTIVYIRLTDRNGHVNCSIIIARSRVAPLKPVTIPRLELVAAVVSVELVGLVTRELKIPIENCVFWNDSTAVLQYIRGTARRYKTFVANRIAAMQSGSSPSQWRHVGSESNPADLASRGITSSELATSKLWYRGPDFLWLEESHWPEPPVGLTALPTDDPELLKLHRVNHSLSVPSGPPASPLGQLVEHFSSFIRLRSAVAWLRRCKELLLAKSKGTDLATVDRASCLSVDELEGAELELIMFCQQCYFFRELSALSDHGDLGAITLCSGGTKRLKGSTLARLCPIKVRGILRVGGRLQRSALPAEERHPIILPSRHHLTALVILHYHVLEGHAGPLRTLAATRAKFWVVKGHATVRRVVGSCRGCRIRNAVSGKQIMAPLPPPRVLPGKPAFT